MSQITAIVFSCLRTECTMGKQLYQFENICACSSNHYLSDAFISVLCKIMEPELYYTDICTQVNLHDYCRNSFSNWLHFFKNMSPVCYTDCFLSSG